ncbi:hypothetical protein O3M35_002167 [Rhynocoris fuscipes]|uniref:Glucose dehydrogenase [FAD, quinone]-like n=1 Tax=Rhynocoris fuscipes TaxID=488301 RepID=A0AAW1CY77_9HEMI
MDYQTFLALLTTAVLYYRYDEFNPAQEVKNQSNDELKKEYDFIIVGAGSAGSVMANRLTEIPEWNVLLFEAGGEETIESQTPFLAVNVWGGPLDWNYTTTYKSLNCLEKASGMCFWPRGKVMGGTSSINSQIYLRGTRQDHNNWAALGNVGWSYEDILPYYKKSEDSLVPSGNDAQFHGYKGYQPISPIPYRSVISGAFIEAGKELGYKETDLNGANDVGFMRVQTFGKNGTRYSTNKAFLKPIRSRKNLSVAKRALVTRIIFEGKRAVGVEFVRDGQKRRINVKKEVIVSGGVINSPQLLMLSGIGPREHLQSFNIPVIADLPVGMNLQDHANTGLMFSVDRNAAPTENEVYSEQSIIDYAQNDRGLLTTPTVNEAIAGIDTKGSPNSQSRNLELTFNSINTNLDDNVTSWAVMVSNLVPKSRGRISLVSSDPFQKPRIDPNYFGDPDDYQIALEGQRFLYKLSQTKAFQKYNSKLIMSSYSACTNETYPSDGFFLCIIKKYSKTAFHPVGSCKMGPNPGDSVVDPRLRVHKLKNVRVIDASIMPLVTKSNTNAPTIMIGEKGADLVKQDHGKLLI